MTTTTTTPLIIDTDPGVDDAFAIALAALSEDVELLGISTVFGNVPLQATTANARRVLALCDRPDVPVAAGAGRPLVYPNPRHARYAHGVDGLSGRAEVLPTPNRPLEQADALTLLATLLRAAKEPVTLAAIGPLTNIALLLAAHPGLREKIARIVIMGGGLAHGNVTSAAEFNIWSDPEAARRVLVDESVPCTLVPLDLTHRCALSAQWLATLADSGTIGRALNALTPDYVEYYRKALGWDGIVMHDAVAVAEAIQPGILDTEAFPIEVECSLGPGRGAILADQRNTSLREQEQPEHAVAVRVAIDTDIDELCSFVLRRLTGRSA